MLAINKTKWKIIEELSKTNKSPTYLAKKLKITLPSVHAHLKAMEQEKLVKKAGFIKGKTRPYAEYSIGNGFVYVIKALPNETEQRFLEANKIKNKIVIYNPSDTLTKEKILHKIEQNKGKIKTFGTEKLTLIGSHGRNEAKPESDIDFLVEFEKGRGSFDDYVHLLQFLRDLFDKEVDLGEERFLREELKQSILGGEKIEAKL